MPDLTAINLSDAVPAPSATSIVDDVRDLVGGAIFTVAVAMIGAILVTLVLTVGVVASPLIAFGIGWVILRRRRSAPRVAPVTG